MSKQLWRLSRNLKFNSIRTIGNLPNLKDVRSLPRVDPGTLVDNLVNPSDKYKADANQRTNYGQYIMTCLPKFIQSFSIWKDELTLYVAPGSLLPVLYFLRDSTTTQYTQLSNVTAVDYPGRTYRFEVIYNLLSIKNNNRIRVKTYASETCPVPSATEVFEGANWYERETYDMFGVLFLNHPDLRRIMTDYGFEGHPLRKDFPLSGYTEIRYDEGKKRVVYEPIELTQAFRNFESGSTSWEPLGKGEDERPDEFRLPEVKEEPTK